MMQSVCHQRLNKVFVVLLKHWWPALQQAGPNFMNKIADFRESEARFAPVGVMFNYLSNVYISCILLEKVITVSDIILFEYI